MIAVWLLLLAAACFALAGLCFLLWLASRLALIVLWLVRGGLTFYRAARR